MSGSRKSAAGEKEGSEKRVPQLLEAVVHMEDRLAGGSWTHADLHRLVNEFIDCSVCWVARVTRGGTVQRNKKSCSWSLHRL